MKRRGLTVTAVLLIVGLGFSSPVSATIPNWWITRGVIDTNLVPNDFAAVTQGQVKNIASNAAAEMDAYLPPLGAGTAITALVNSFSPTNNYLAANLGQLKYVAQPFYDRLIAVGYTNAYPWASSPTTNDYATANIGQLKYLFAWDIATDTVGDGIPDWWRAAYFGGDGTTTDSYSCASCDPAGDGIDNLQKYEYGLNPQVAYTLDVVVNGGSVWATNQTITLDATSFPFPFLEVSLYPTMSNAVLLANTGVPLTYALPSASNATYYLFLQYADAQTNALGPVLPKIITLDTIPPWVDITSPTNSTSSDAFVHLQATVYDPDPQNPSAPGTFRPVKIWINGQPYWNLSNNQIDIPRFPVVAYTNNPITIVAQDQAGNTTQAGTDIYVNPTNTAPPQLSFDTLQPNTTTILPTMSQIWLSGQMDDLNAIVMASVNGGDPITMNVRSNRFGYLLPLTSGTNTVVIMGSNAAGLVSSNTFTLVNNNDYQLAITSTDPFNTYDNGQPQVIGGSVSQYRDAQQPNPSEIVSVTVNGVGTTLGTTPDGNGNITFTTTNAVPVSTDGSPTVLSVTVTWADGRSAAPPVGLLEGYFITAIKRTSFTDSLYMFEPCEPYWSYEETSTYLFFMPVASFDVWPGSGLIDEIYLDRILQPYSSCDWGVGTSYETDTTNGDWVAQPDNWGLVFMNDPFSKTGPDAWGGTLIYNQEWLQDGQLSFQAPSYYPSNTWVLFTFSGVSYATTNALDLSQVTYRGQRPVEWDGDSVSYLIKVSPRVNYTISAGSFSWPPGYCEAGTYTNGDEYTDWEESFNWFWFGHFGNSPMTLQVTPNLFTNCVGNTQSLTASAGAGAPGTLSYVWTATGGATITASGSQAQVTLNNPGTVTVTVGSGPLSATANGTVVEVASLAADQGQMVGGITDIVDWASSGVVTVTATPNPSIPPANLPGCWQMTGGDEISKTVHTVPKSVPAITTIAVTAGTSTKTVVVAVVKCTFTAYARRGSSCLNVFGSDFGHAWWELAIEPGDACVLAGGDPSTGPQAYVNRYLGWTCLNCTSCTDIGYLEKDAANNSPTHCHTWLITLNQLKSGSLFSAGQDIPLPSGYYKCAPPGAYNCVTVAINAGSSVGVTIPSSWCPDDLDDWLAQLSQCQ